MNPWLSNNDKQMFYKHLDKINIYFEYGSGGRKVSGSLHFEPEVFQKKGKFQKAHNSDPKNKEK